MTRSLGAPPVAISILLAVLLFVVSTPSRAQGVPPAWRDVWAFLVEDVCTDGSDHPIPGTSPLDGGCSRPRTLRVGERLPYHKQDWAGNADQDAHPDGYQRSDSFPVSSTLGPAVVQSYDFGDAPRAFEQFDDGDGGQVAFLGADGASFGITEDGGAGLQFFLGPDCTPENGWLIAGRSFASRTTGQALARITRNAARCPQRLGYAFTRWHVQPLGYRDSLRGRTGRITLSTLVSEHFGGKDVDGAEHLERMYFTHELGYTRWERWQNLSVHDRPRDRQQATELGASDRCEPELEAPSATTRWVMVDCREWTRIVAPYDPAGDVPGFWLDRLRTYAATRSMFP